MKLSKKGLEKTGFFQKKILLIFLVLIISSISVLAHGQETFAIAEEIIESKISCEQLSDDQLEMLGDYYMEQMHPGETHEEMDERMGGEGSASLKQMHINMARNFYCGEHEAMGSGMMNMMMGRNTGMMGSSGFNNQGRMMNSSFFGMGYWFIFMILFWGLLIWLIIWIITQYTKPKKGGKKESAIEILKKRFAKGEISKKQYEEIKKEINRVNG